MPQLTLREATLDDAPSILAWRNDAITVRFSGTQAAVSQSDHQDWMSRRLNDPDTRLWVAQVDGAAVGQVRLERQRDHAEVHIAVAPEARGRGYGQAMIRAVQERARELPGVTHLLARVHLGNVASMRAFTACGFAESSADGEFAQLDWPLAAASGSGVSTG